MRRAYNYMVKLNKKQKAALCIVLIVIYFGSYVIISMCGEYQMTMSGEHRYSFGLAVMDIYKWTPYGVVCEVYRDVSGKRSVRGLNILGALYFPLVWVDRKYVHQNLDIFDDKKDW